MSKRTDLALEAKALYEQSAEQTTQLSGVIARERMQDGIRLTHIEITDHRGQKALGKPKGHYITLELASREPDASLRQRASRLMGEMLGSLLKLGQEDTVLVVGLGNRDIPPDAIGPDTVDGVFLTRHLLQTFPREFGAFRRVCAVAPGVLADTGFESQELVAAAVQRARPDKVLVVDALASCEAQRVCTTIQLTDTGIVPGSGVGNARPAFNERTLGVPVVAVGVPTVMDLSACTDTVRDNGLMVTPRSIDRQAKALAQLLSDGINRALFSPDAYRAIDSLRL